MKILTMCLSGHKRFPLGSTNPEIVQTGLKVTQRAIDTWTCRLGTRVIQIPAFDVYETETRTEETQKRYVDNLYKVARMDRTACMCHTGDRASGRKSSGSERYYGGCPAD